jgi:hypothetical protein
VFYSFSPAATGAFNQPVVVTSDVGAVTATLQGNGVLGAVATRELPSLSQVALAFLALLMLAAGVFASPFRRNG